MDELGGFISICDDFIVSHDQGKSVIGTFRTQTQTQQRAGVDIVAGGIVRYRGV